jgi:hypothetical protein
MTRIRDTVSFVVCSTGFETSCALAGATAYIVEKEKTVVIRRKVGTAARMGDT